MWNSLTKLKLVVVLYHKNILLFTKMDRYCIRKGELTEIKRHLQVLNDKSKLLIRLCGSV